MRSMDLDAIKPRLCHHPRGARKLRYDGADFRDGHLPRCAEEQEAH
jgi:hypothetical protein